MNIEEVVRKNLYLIERLADGEAILRSVYDGYEKMVAAGIDADYLLSKDEEIRKVARSFDKIEREKLADEILGHTITDEEKIKENVLKIRKEKIVNETIQDSFDNLSYYFNGKKSIGSTYDELMNLARSGVDADFLLNNHSKILNTIAFPNDDAVNKLIDEILDNINLEEEKAQEGVSKIREESKNPRHDVIRTIAIIFAQKRKEKLSFAKKMFAKKITDKISVEEINDMYKPKTK